MLPIAGTVPTTEGALYTVPSKTRARIVWISVINTNTAADTVELFATVRGTKVELTPSVSLDGNNSLQEDATFYLDENAIIRGVAGTTGFKYLISGEETPYARS